LRVYRAPHVEGQAPGISWHTCRAPSLLTHLGDPVVQDDTTSTCCRLERALLEIGFNPFFSAALPFLMTALFFTLATHTMFFIRCLSLGDWTEIKSQAVSTCHTRICGMEHQALFGFCFSKGLRITTVLQSHNLTSIRI